MYFIKHWLPRKISRGQLDLFLAPYANDGRTLEVGIRGNTRHGRFFPNRIGIDIKSGPGVDVVASVYELPFVENEFDTVLCVSVLEHLEDPRKAIAEMHRVLKPGGKIIISVPFLFPIHDAPGDYWRFTKYGLRNLFSEGWNIEELRGDQNPQESFALLLQRLSYQTKMRLNAVSKFILLLGARIISALPSMFTQVFGDISKKVPEHDAFASAFFLVAKKQ